MCTGILPDSFAKHIRHIPLLFFLHCFIPIGISAQSIDSLQQFNDPVPNLLQLSSSRQINNYFYNGLVNYRYRSQSFSIFHSSLFSSSILKSDKVTSAENYSGKLTLEFPCVPNWIIGSSVLHNWHTDTRVSDLNSVSQKGVLGFVKFEQAGIFRISGGVGYLQNSQSQKDDDGVILDILGSTSGISVLETILNSSLTIHEEITKPRQNYTNSINLQVLNSFSDSVQNTIEFQYRDQRNDYYLKSDPYVMDEFGSPYNIHKRTEKNISFFEKLANLPIVADFAELYLKTGITQKNIHRDYMYTPQDITATSAVPTNSTENKLEIVTGLQLSYHGIQSVFQVQFQDRHEKYGVERMDKFKESAFQDRLSNELLKNNHSRRYFLSSLNRFEISASQALVLTLSHSKLTYDTPSDENFDDRDELLSIGRIEYFRKFNSFFSGSARLEGSINTFSYLFKERSANNYTNRIIKLAFNTLYSGKRLTSMNYFEIFGNYTVYSYEKFSDNTKSFSFRQLSFTDSTQYKLHDNMMLKWKSNYKISEQGTLYWSSFSQYPLRNTEEILFHPEISVRLYNLTCSSGYRIFIVNTFLYKNTRKLLDNVFRSSGPTVTVATNQNEQLFISFSGWIDNVKTNNSSFSRQPNFQFSLSYKL